MSKSPLVNSVCGQNNFSVFDTLTRSGIMAISSRSCSIVQVDGDVSSASRANFGSRNVPLYKSNVWTTAQIADGSVNKPFRFVPYVINNCFTAANDTASSQCLH